MAAPQTRSKTAAVLAVGGGFAQVIAALAILFLPVLGSCLASAGGVSCVRVSYVQLGGNLLGYGILIAMIAVGVLAISSAREANRRRNLIIRWGGALFSGAAAFITGFSFGSVFVPGALLLLASAIWTTVNRAA